MKIQKKKNFLGGGGGGGGFRWGVGLVGWVGYGAMFRVGGVMGYGGCEP